MPSSRTGKPKSKRQLRSAHRKGLPGSDQKEHILFVDDEKWLVQIGQKILEGLGYQVTGSTSGMEALETVRQQPERFDLVITDFFMPQMTGIELARELTSLRPGMPIILYTASYQAISSEYAKQMGIAAYLNKPARAVEMNQAIRRVLDARLPGGHFSKR